MLQDFQWTVEEGGVGEELQQQRRRQVWEREQGLGLVSQTSGAWRSWDQKVGGKCLSMSDSCCDSCFTALNRGLMLSHHSQKVLSGGLSWVHVMAWLLCHDRDSNPGLRCHSVMLYHCSTEGCWIQMRSTKKVTKNYLFISKSKNKVLAYNPQQNLVLEKNKVLRRAKIVSKGTKS